MVLKGNKCGLVLYLADDLVSSKSLCAFAHNVNHFQMFIQIGGNCIYADSRVDYGADLKGSRLREFSIF